MNFLFLSQRRNSIVVQIFEESDGIFVLGVFFSDKIRLSKKPYHKSSQFLHDSVNYSGLNIVNLEIWDN